MAESSKDSIRNPGLSRQSSSGSLRSYDGSQEGRIGDHPIQRAYTISEQQKHIPGSLRSFERGLRHRQLDTIAFFLKNKESLFSLNEEANASLEIASPADPQLSLLTHMVDLVSGIVTENAYQTQLHHFTQQLLRIFLEYLQKLMKSVISGLNEAQLSGKSTAELQLQTEQRLTKLTDYMEEVKRSIRDLERAGTQPNLQRQAQGLQSAVERRLGCVLSDKQRRLVLLWDSLEKQALTVEGILSGEIPLLQTYLLRRYRPQAADLSRIIETGLEEGLAFIQDRDILNARNMFANMGFDPDSKLRQICLYTPDKPLREYLLSELSREGKLSTEEQQMIHFVHTLESYYSCPSYDVARILREEGLRSSASVDPLKALQSTITSGQSLTFDLRSNCGDLVQRDISNSETSSYSQVLLEWSRHWSRDRQSRILLEHALSRKDCSLESLSVSAALVWDYLCCHLDVKRLTHWIDVQFPDNEPDELTNKWPYNQPITQDMLESLCKCPQYLQEELIDNLARRGIFVPWEAKDLDLLRRRLSRNTAIFSKPHLVEKRGTRHNITLLNLHYHMIKYCIENKLPAMLYFYLDYWRLCCMSTTLEDIGILADDLPPWVSMMLHFRRASAMLFDSDTVFELSLCSSVYTQKLNESTVAAMIDHGLLIQAISTLAYNPPQLHTFVNDADDDLVQRFCVHPQLQHALFSGRLPEVQQPANLTVYHLLLKNAPLDVTRLFGWQKTNTLAGDEAPQMLPHFSHEPLVAKYSRQEHIHYSYYLKQGRPCYAFCAFIMEQVNSGARVLQQKRVNEVCLHAILIAVHHFNDITISAACSALTEMLAIDSTPLRLHLEAATNIYKYLACHMVLPAGGDERKREERILQRAIGNLLHQCLKGHRASRIQVLNMLCAATYWLIGKNAIKRVSLEAGMKWHLPILFCVYYDLDMCTQFLQDCAQQGNWPMFFTFAQLHQYPARQLEDVIKLFPNVHVQEHFSCILKAVGSSKSSPNKKQSSPACQSPRRPSPKRQSERKSEMIKEKRAKPKTSPDKPNEGGSSSAVEAVDTEDSTECQGLMSTTPQSPVSDVAAVDICAGDDLFKLLQQIQGETDPAAILCAQAILHRNPLLAVLATTFQDHNPMQCLGSWLLASSPSSITDAILATNTSQSQITWSLVTMTTLRDALIALSLHDLILKALWIFLPDCMLVSYLRFYQSINADDDKADSIQHLMAFKRAYRKVRSVSSPGMSCPQSPVLPVMWIEETIARMTHHFLENCQIVGRIEKMLKCIDELNIFRFFECKVFDISLLLKLHQVTRETGIHIDFVLLGNKDQPEHRNTCCKVLGQLQEGKFYNEARLVAEILGVENHSITIQQLHEELRNLQKSAMWDSEDTRRTFWGRCHDILSKHRVDPKLASDFFLLQTDSSKSVQEKASLYKQAYDWLVQMDEGSGLTERKHEVFVNMWMSEIQAYLAGKDCVLTTKSHKLKKEELLTFDPKRLKYDLTLSEHPVDLSKEQENALSYLIGQLLNEGRISQAVDVGKHFGFKSTDLDIILTCLQLAKGQSAPERLSREMRIVLSNPQPARLRRISTSTSSFPRTISMVSVTSLVTQTDSDGEEEDRGVVATIQGLSQHCTHAKNCAAFILTAYKISQLLKQKFDWVLTLEDFALIHRILASQSENTYLLAKAYVVTSGLDDIQVSGFLCDAIVEALQFTTGIIDYVSTSYGTDKPILLQSSADPTGLTGSGVRGSGLGGTGLRGTRVQELIQLCQEPAVLGTRLLESIQSLMSSNADSTRKTLTVEVELLIYAHDCFTQSCHMEGISAVLRTARHIVEALAQAEEYILMMWLLTGVARYSEMTYIFDVLKQQHQFELLFRKGMDRDTRLRLSILDYLQRFHPEDLDTYSMAALNFTMYREIGQMLEEEAKKQLQLLKNKSLENTNECQLTLKKALRFYSDAAESYVKENCLRHAENCVRRARLVALQMQLLPNKKQVIHLDRNDLQTFVTGHPKFYEAYIVCEAYNSHVYWVEALYQQVVRAGSSKYLQDFTNHVTLTPSLILEVAEKYQADSQTTKQSGANFRKILTQCSDVQVLYKVALSLGFQDVIKDTLRSDSMKEAYLKDLGVLS